jgi:hypothetical protein
MELNWDMVDFVTAVWFFGMAAIWEPSTPGNLILKCLQFGLCLLFVVRLFV